MKQFLTRKIQKGIQHGLEKHSELSGMVRQTQENAKKRFFKAGSLVQAEKTPFEVIHQNDIVTLRYYPPLDCHSILLDNGKGGQITIEVETTPHKTPLVMVAPLAVNMYIYDLFPTRSLVKFLRAKGFELYLIDWGTPGWRQNHYSIETYITQFMPEMIDKVCEHSGKEQVSLHGWSFGGVFSAGFAALDKRVKNVALVGAPCDYHANGELGEQYQKISKNLRWVEKQWGWRVHNTRQRWWRSPGWANALAFKLTNPVGSIQGYMDLIKNLHDQDYVVSHATNAAFLDDMVAYPGAVIQDVIQFLWIDNIMAKGEIPLRNLRASFSDITADLLMVTGKNDPIVTTDCGLKLFEFVGSKNKEHHEVKGGHMGILSGSKSSVDVWPMVADWLIARS